MKKVISIFFILPLFLSGCFINDWFNKTKNSSQEEKNISSTESLESNGDKAVEKTEFSDCEIKLYNNIAYDKYVNGKRHIIFNDNDLGEGGYPVLSGNNIAFIKEINNEEHVIYNGEDMGTTDESESLILEGDNIAFVRDSKIIYNGEEYGEMIGKRGHWHDMIKLSLGNIAYSTANSRHSTSTVFLNNKKIGDGYDIDLFGKNIAFASQSHEPEVNIGNINFNGQNLGYGLSPKISGENIVFLSTANDEEWHLQVNNNIINSSESEDDFSRIRLLRDQVSYIMKKGPGEFECYYNKENIGSCVDIFPLKNDFWAVGKDSFLFNKDGKVRTIGRDSLKIYGDTIAYVSSVAGSPDYYAFVNHENVGTIIQESGDDQIMLSGKNYAFEREIDGVSHIIYNGEDLGPGRNPVLPDMDQYNTICELTYPENQTDIGASNEEVININAQEKIKQCEEDYPDEEKKIECIGKVILEFKDTKLCGALPKEDYVAVCKFEINESLGKNERENHVLFRSQGQPDTEYESIFDIKLYDNGINLSIKPDYLPMYKDEEEEEKLEYTKIYYGKLNEYDDDFSMENIIENHGKTTAELFTICLDELKANTHYIFQPVFVYNDGSQERDDMSSFTTSNIGKTFSCDSKNTKELSINNTTVNINKNTAEISWEFTGDFTKVYTYLYNGPDFQHDQRLDKQQVLETENGKFRISFSNLKNQKYYYLIEVEQGRNEIFEQGDFVISDIVDSDNDGISDSEENNYGTDPQNPDTDADGFLDGEEIKSGYNPLGEGRLE